MKKYTLKLRRGIDDLQSEHAFIGAAQGDHSSTNSVNDYRNSEGWLIYVFSDRIDKYDQNAVNKESERRKEENKRIIQTLKDQETYGEEYGIDINFKENPLFDTPINPNDYVSLESYKMHFIDMSK